MHYPPKFSEKARAAVEAEVIRAGRRHDDRKRNWKSDWSFPEDQSIRTCILEVFLVYAREAIELGKSGVWRVDQVRLETLEGLRRITVEVGLKKDYEHFIESNGGSIRTEAQRKFEITREWQQFEDEFLALSDSKQLPEKPSAETTIGAQNPEILTRQQPPERVPDADAIEATEIASDIPSPSQMARIRKRGRRYKAQRAALDLVFAVQLTADAELLQEAANAVQESWPRDTHHLEQVLWPSFSKYSITLFSKLAESRLDKVSSDRAVRRYVHWLRCTCVSAVVEDLCRGMRFSDIAKHIFDVIGEVRWPEHAPETRRALARMMTEVLGGPHSESLEKRLRVLLDARLGSLGSCSHRESIKGSISPEEGRRALGA